MTRCVFTAPSLNDLEEIHDYIAEQSPERAERWIRRLRVQCELLAEMPGLGRARPEIGQAIRSLAVRSYLILYREVEGGIEIVRVVHGARRINRLGG